jgi:hypothetical protein
VAFFASSTEFDPLFDIVSSTPDGPALVYVQNFSLSEYLNTTTTTSASGGHDGSGGSATTVRAYYSVSGNDTEAYFLDTGDLEIGFSVLQVENVTTERSSGPFGGMQLVNRSSTVVYGTGAFVGMLNSEGELLSPLVSNQAFTEKTVSDLTVGPNGHLTLFVLREAAVNDSLVNRNGTLLYLHER